MAPKKDAQPEAEFLDMQAYVGISKHVGGLEATNELLALCHIEAAREVLNAGCGIGAGSTYVARNYGCHVVGVDISDKMIEWSRRRAREERVEDKVELQPANALDLPFETDRFDVVFAESVLTFVEDKARAIRECVRVTKPGGYVGLNEGSWIKAPPPELAAQVRDALGPFVVTDEAWQALWKASGLQEQVVTFHEIDAGEEVKSRIQWIGWPWLLRAWGRGLRLYITNPAIRRSIKEMFDVPAEVFQYMAYGLFVGKKT
jgi:arsenite methyltransferase